MFLLCFGSDTESASVVVDRLAALKDSAQGQLGAIVRIPDDPAGTRLILLTDAELFIATRTWVGRSMAVPTRDRLGGDCLFGTQEQG